jgi:hypothetical protein
MMPDPSHARPLRWFLLAALFIVVLGAYANAQTPLNTSEDLGVYLTIVDPDEHGRIGEIVHRNGLTFPFNSSNFLEFETERGLVILHLETTPNKACAGTVTPGCPDTLTIWELPEGVMASQMESVTPEMETVTITLFEWSGM